MIILEAADGYQVEGSIPSFSEYSRYQAVPMANMFLKRSDGWTRPLIEDLIRQLKVVL